MDYLKTFSHDESDVVLKEQKYIFEDGEKKIQYLDVNAEYSDDENQNSS